LHEETRNSDTSAAYDRNISFQTPEFPFLVIPCQHLVSVYCLTGVEGSIMKETTLVY